MHLRPAVLKQLADFVLLLCLFCKTCSYVLIDALFCGQVKKLADKSIWHGHLSGGQVENFPYFYQCVYVCACVRACVRVCVCACQLVGHFSSKPHSKGYIFKNTLEIKASIWLNSSYSWKIVEAQGLSGRMPDSRPRERRHESPTHWRRWWQLVVALLRHDKTKSLYLYFAINRDLWFFMIFIAALWLYLTMQRKKYCFAEHYILMRRISSG